MDKLSVRKYAEMRGCSHTAVLKAIKSCRLVEAISIDAKGNKVIDPTIADREWPKGTQELFKTQGQPPENTGTIPEQAKPITPGSGKEKPATPVPTDQEVKKLPTPPAPDEERAALDNFTTARARVEEIKAKRAQLELDEKAARLVSADAMEKDWVTAATSIRTKVMGIPSKAKQQIPELTPAGYASLMQICTESLEDLADGKS